MDLPTLLLIALLPAIGFQLGAVIAEVFDPPAWLLGATLHAAAGIALAVVALELSPRSLAIGPAASTFIAFAAGATLSVLFVRLAGKARKVTGTKEGALVVYAVALADLFSDGLMTGAGAVVAPELGLLLAGSQVVANIPSGFSATAHLQDHGGGRLLRLGLGAAMFLPALGAALLGWFSLHGQPDAIQAIALSGVAGLLLAATVEDLIPEADKPQSARGVSTAALTGGFVFLAALSRL